MPSRCVRLPNGFQRRLKMHRLDKRCEQSHKMRACVQDSAWVPHVRCHPPSTQTQHPLDNISLRESSKDIRNTRKRACLKATSRLRKRYGRLTTAHATVEIFFVHFRCTTSLLQVLHARWSLQTTFIKIRYRTWSLMEL